MKKLLALLVVSLIVSLSLEAKVVKRPYISAGNVYGFDIAEVELTDSVTRLRIVTEGYVEEPIVIADGSYLEADGRKYRMRRMEQAGEGEPSADGDEVTVEFDLWFEPMPKATKVFDFVEGERGEGRKLWDVDLTRRKRTVPDVMRAKEPADAELPAFELTMDSVTINLHILNYKPKMGRRVTYFVNYLSGQVNNTDELPKVDVDEQGNCRFKLLARGTGYVMFVNVGENRLDATVTVAPGEEIDVWADAGYSGRAAMDRRKGADKERIWGISNGRYRNYDLAYAKIWSKDDYGMELHSGRFADYRMTADEYTDYVIRMYEDLLAQINADRKLTAFQKKVARNKLAADLIEATVSRDYLLKHNYCMTYKCFNQDIPKDSIRADFNAEHTRRIAEAVNINEPTLLLEWLMIRAASPVFKEAGVDDRLIYPLYLFHTMYKAAGTDEQLNREAFDELKSFNVPLYTQAVEHRHEELMVSMNKYDTQKIMPAPEVPDSEVFDAIIAPHKGKVVVIDMWNTWCGPCRVAIRSHEPLKKTSLADKDIVWIYLADESSPKDLYMKMVQEIDGIHYRLPDSQSDAVANRFGIRTIPAYILVDREGHAALRNDMRDSDRSFEKAILDALKRQ